MAPFARAVEGGVELQLLVQPRASRSRVVGPHQDRLKVQIAAPPVEGEANAALIELLSDLLGVPRRQIELLAGETGRRKRVRILGVDLATVSRCVEG